MGMASFSILLMDHLENHLKVKDAFVRGGSTISDDLYTCSENSYENVSLFLRGWSYKRFQGQSFGIRLPDFPIHGWYLNTC